MKLKKNGGLIRQLDPFPKLALAAMMSNTIYIVWLAFQIRTPLGAAFFVLECLVFVIVAVFCFNHFRRRYDLLGGVYSLRASVDVFIPTVNEAIDILRDTVEAACAIDCPSKQVYILDDGNRQKVRKLAQEFQCHYLSRPDSKTKCYKAANLNYGLANSRGDYVLTIDADNVVSSNIVDDLIGHFKDKKVAIVASRQSFVVEKEDFNHDHLFYNYMQTGKNKDGVAISCGSGVIYRRSALRQIGGFSEWNLVEDLHTTYIMNQSGWRSVYVTQPYVRGHAPRDLRTIYKQRGTWALDTLRIFFWQQPLLCRKLKLRQRLHYFEIGYSYVVSAFVLPLIFAINFYTLYTNSRLINGGWDYVLVRTPAMICTLLLFGRFSQGQLTSRIWAGLFPVYAKAAILAIFHPKNKPPYKVTSKIDVGSRDIKLIIPQVLFALSGVGGVIYHFFKYGQTIIMWFCLFWIIVMLYWIWPILIKGAFPIKPQLQE